MLETIGAKIDAFIGINGASGYLLIAALIFIGFQWVNKSSIIMKEEQGDHESDDETDPDPPRNFTTKQLRDFDGTKKGDDDDEEKSVYLSLNGVVFDVSRGREFYGPGGPYELFAGRECGAALAKMSFDETYLDDMAACDKLSFGEKDELENWMAKFEHYRAYPIKGRLVPDSKLPNPKTIVTKNDLAKSDGTGQIPDGYATAPIYIGVGQNVYDGSFGGVTHYGKDGAYERFAGKDVSRALAKMSFDPKDTENTSIDDLTEKELVVLNDWVKTYEHKKGYPVVGIIQK